MIETAFPALRPLKCISCITHTSPEDYDIDSTDCPYRAPSLLSETVARSCTGLILTRCNIEELPELIGMYYLLRVLDVSENKLTELPPDIGSCYSLRTLNFATNMIKVIPDEIQQLPYLEKLLCYSNRITVIPEWVGMLPLTEFNIFNNRVLKLPECVGQLTGVAEMNLAANVVMQVPPSAMTNWQNVTILNLYDCRLVKMAPIGHCTSLEEIRLFNNHLTTAPDFCGKVLPKLTLIEINRNQIAELPLSFFKSIPAAEKVVLNHNLITDVPSGIDCPNLKALIIGDNKLTSLPPDLPLLPNLKILFLNGNQLASLPETFVQAKHLERVNLSRNNKLRETSMAICVHIKKALDKNNGQYWAPDSL